MSSSQFENMYIPVDFMNYNSYSLGKNQIDVKRSELYSIVLSNVQVEKHSKPMEYSTEKQSLYQIIFDNYNKGISKELFNSSITIEINMKQPMKPTKEKEAEVAVEVPAKKKIERTYNYGPNEEKRCLARVFNPKEHLENGALKVMREDSKNQYGDRCKLYKKEKEDFCNFHSEEQKFGKWDTDEYKGTIHEYMNKK